MNNDSNNKKYIHLKNILNITDIKLLFSSIYDCKYVDNNIVKKYIDTCIVNNINSTLNWKMSYNRFKFSKSQSLHKALSHVNIYNYADNDVNNDNENNDMFIFTVLTCLDKTTIYIDSELVTLENTDILLFKSNIPKRYITKNSRILEIYNVFPSLKFEKIYQPLIYNVNVNEYLSLYNDITDIFKKGKYITYFNNDVSLDATKMHLWSTGIYLGKYNNIEPSKINKKLVITFITILLILLLKK